MLLEAFENCLFAGCLWETPRSSPRRRALPASSPPMNSSMAELDRKRKSQTDISTFFRQPRALSKPRNARIDEVILYDKEFSEKLEKLDGLEQEAAAIEKELGMPESRVYHCYDCNGKMFYSAQKRTQLRNEGIFPGVKSNRVICALCRGHNRKNKPSSFLPQYSDFKAEHGRIEKTG